MSSAIPGCLEYPDVLRYCIWHPQLASEETYRDLAPCYPEMRYRVGWACAANYVSRQRDLDLLPNASIAEEA